MIRVPSLLSEPWITHYTFSDTLFFSRADRPTESVIHVFSHMSEHFMSQSLCSLLPAWVLLEAACAIFICSPNLPLSFASALMKNLFSSPHHTHTQSYFIQYLDRVAPPPPLSLSLLTTSDPPGRVVVWQRDGERVESSNLSIVCWQTEQDVRVCVSVCVCECTFIFVRTILSIDPTEGGHFHCTSLFLMLVWGFRLGFRVKVNARLG